METTRIARTLGLISSSESSDEIHCLKVVSDQASIPSEVARLSEFGWANRQGLPHDQP